MTICLNGKTIDSTKYVKKATHSLTQDGLLSPDEAGRIVAVADPLLQDIFGVRGGALMGPQIIVREIGEGRAAEIGNLGVWLVHATIARAGTRTGIEERKQQSGDGEFGRNAAILGARQLLNAAHQAGFTLPGTEMILESARAFQPATTVTAATRALVTDLDGTFLYGSDQQKSELYKQLNHESRDCIVIFCTGRPVDLVAHLMYGQHDIPVPLPDAIIGNVGTEVFVRVKGTTAYLPFEPINNEIAQRWQTVGGETGTLARIQKTDAWRSGKLQQQEIVAKNRLALYVVEGAELSAEEIDQITTELGPNLKFQISNQGQIDILPGVDKGTTATQLLRHASGYCEGNEIFAGDTGNDLSLLHQPRSKPGIATSIVVGNALPELRDPMSKQPYARLHVAAGAGAILRELRRNE